VRGIESLPVRSEQPRRPATSFNSPKGTASESTRFNWAA
jgi:hypothetical protein